MLGDRISNESLCRGKNTLRKSLIEVCTWIIRRKLRRSIGCMMLYLLRVIIRSMYCILVELLDILKVYIEAKVGS